MTVGLEQLVLDTWSSLSHKTPLRRPRSMVGADWMSEQDRRRLTAYIILAAYRENVSRTFLSVDPEEEGAQDDHREYGDAALVIEQTLSAVIGEEQTIAVDGAEAGEDADDEPDPGAVAVQEWLREWAVAERFVLSMIEVETDAVTTGDGVYLLAWDPRKQRVRLRTLDPGFYFPVLDDDLDSDYPTRVHFAWELEADPLRGVPRRLRRITYELGPIGPETEVRPNDGTGVLRRVLRWVGGEVPEPVLYRGDEWDGEGRIVRQYPWNDEPEAVTCYLTDATWDLDKLDTRDALDSLDLSAATFATGPDGELLDRLDLRIDFLPIVHLPNTVARRAHYGTSSLARVLQLLDDIAATDTDLQAASSTTGSPPIGLSGASVPVDADGRSRLRVAPGEVWNLGPDGKLSSVDTSPALEALGKRDEALLARLSANSRLPEAILGRVSPADVPSGYAVALTFAPYKAMVRTMRLSREEKYPLLLKMVQRLGMLGGVFPHTEVLPAEVLFGSYLPDDLDAVIGQVVKLLDAGAISLRTGLVMLQEAGLPIEEVDEEVERIEARSFELANQLADATGDVDAVREFLGLEPQQAAPVAAPPVGALTLPGVPQAARPDPARLAPEPPVEPTP